MFNYFDRVSLNKTNKSGRNSTRNSLEPEQPSSRQGRTSIGKGESKRTSIGKGESKRTSLGKAEQAKRKRDVPDDEGEYRRNDFRNKKGKKLFPYTITLYVMLPS